MNNLRIQHEDVSEEIDDVLYEVWRTAVLMGAKIQAGVEDHDEASSVAKSEIESARNEILDIVEG